MGVIGDGSSIAPVTVATIRSWVEQHHDANGSNGTKTASRLEVKQPKRDAPAVSPVVSSVHGDDSSKSKSVRPSGCACELAGKVRSNVPAKAVLQRNRFGGLAQSQPNLNIFIGAG